MTKLFKEFYSTVEAAGILGISRISVFKKIKSGSLKAKRVGRNYIIPREELIFDPEKSISRDTQDEIVEAVKKAVDEYGKAFKMLGRE